MLGYRSAAAARQYQSIGVDTGVASASPERLVLLLLQGAEQRLATARGCLERGEIGRRGECVSRTLAILEELRGALDHGAGGDIAAGLDSLYDYMARRLMAANVAGDAVGLDEVRGLFTQLREGWQEMMTARAGTEVA